MLERLHKILARAGWGSRRSCEKLIAEGRVWVDGKPITTMGVKVDPSACTIYCDGQQVRVRECLRYFLLNKPRGVLCTRHDPEGRKTVFHLLPPLRERLFSIGRLDAESEGLLLLTNDGALCNRMTHPRYQVPRTYHVVVEGTLTPEMVQKIQKGVWLSEGKTAPVKVYIKKRERRVTVLEVTLGEGLNREVRRIFSKFSLKVRQLKRIRWASLELGALGRGQCRELTSEELRRLKDCAKVSSEKIGERRSYEI